LSNVIFQLASNSIPSIGCLEVLKDQRKFR